MAKQINTRVLEGFLNRTGPYIYFYDAKYEGINEKIVRYSNENATKFPQIKVFQIDWADTVKNHPNIAQNDMNKLFLYFNGKRVEEKLIFDMDHIDYVFKKAVECYNINILKRAKNLGSNPKKISRKTNNLNDRDIIFKELKREHKLQIQRKYLLKKRIRTISEDNDAHKYIKPSNDPVKTSDESIFNYKFINPETNISITSVKKFKKPPQKKLIYNSITEKTFSHSHLERTISESPQDLAICLETPKIFNQKRTLKLSTKYKKELLLSSTIGNGFTAKTINPNEITTYLKSNFENKK